MNIVESRNLLFSQDNVLMKRQAKHYLEKCSVFLIHEINNLNIYDFESYFEVVNKTTLKIKVFQTKEAAINFCLDNFKSSKRISQKVLF